jgi:hypothetical protein
MGFFLTYLHMNGILQAQLLTERLRKARDKAWRASFSMTSEEMMEQMWRNGSDKKPNPWYRGPENVGDSSTPDDSEDSYLVTLS